MNRYERYKDSGIPWLGEIPEHWNICRLKDEVTFNDEVLGDKTDEDYEILYVDISSVSLIEGIVQKEPMSFENSPSRARRIVKNGDVIVSTVRTYLKAITQIQDAEDNLIVSTGFAVLRPKENLFPRFLGYWVQSENMIGAIVSNSVGVSYPAINATDLVRLPIVKLPLKEQTAIAHYLDTKLGEIDALIDKQQTLIEKLAEQRTAVITHAVTKGLAPAAPMKKSGIEWLGDVPEHWEIIKNKYILEFSKGLTITKENLMDDGIPCVSYGEIHSKYGFEVNPEKHLLKCVSEEYLENNDHAYLKNGDFVFADTSEDVKGSGNFTYLNSNLPVFAGYHTIVARPNLRKVLPRFLAYVFDSNAHRNQIRAMVKGVKVFSITQAFLKNTFSWLPSKKEQTAIAEYLDKETAKIDCLCETVNQTIGRLKEYRTALITQAVTGKIKVTDE